MNLSCPHCQQPVFRESGGKAKLGRSAVVLHKGGDVEINCPRCRRGVVLGAIRDVALRKAQAPRFIVPHAKSSSDT